MTTLALIVGIIIINIWQPGVGMNVDVKSIDTKSIQVYTTKAGQQSTIEFLMNIVPSTIVGAFARKRDSSLTSTQPWQSHSAGPWLQNLSQAEPK